MIHNSIAGKPIEARNQPSIIGSSIDGDAMATSSLAKECGSVAKYQRFRVERCSRKAKVHPMTQGQSHHHSWN
ncbi:uncharacterized protein BO72DRAFT_452922 [Aspergillus fijiensis CBS 313.89]|uniref:Uncharacterized protein n=1 Tax=Aspergillus fijiensis CBS 313.89 TaxID=1448319 RepID=A0A8G1RFC1_9EURO|nr:uncharacterized protein BO72DRAFT_452922 [Aspergillus fijiensis CBS 313.89]RAK72219.1 hypothetical protein BO72DRAFT_452922 [Aspergillus fijiensis CBS 313.89]